MPARLDSWEITFIRRIEELKGEMSIRQMSQRTSHNHETVRRFLVGQAPSAAFLVAVSRAFGVTVDWLLGLSSKRK